MRAASRGQALTLGERFENFRFLVRDRGSNFTESFDVVLQANASSGTRAASSWTAC